MLLLFGAAEREVLALLQDVREGRLVRVPETPATVKFVNFLNGGEQPQSAGSAPLTPQGTGTTSADKKQPVQRPPALPPMAEAIEAACVRCAFSNERELSANRVMARSLLKEGIAEREIIRRIERGPERGRRASVFTPSIG